MQRDASETTCTSSSRANVPNLPGRRAETLIARLADGLRDDQFWSDLFRRRACGECSHWALHVAIFQEPFLTWIIEGRKRVESRFSHHQVAPYGDVGAGDVIALIGDLGAGKTTFACYLAYRFRQAGFRATSSSIAAPYQRVAVSQARS